MRLRAAVPLLIALAALVTGCGSEGGIAKSGDPANGKKLFLTKGRCGSCHVLKDAGSKGATGPSLDDAFAADKQHGFKESTIRQVVRDQIRFASAPMPENLVTGSDAEDVATYVAKCAARSCPELVVSIVPPGSGRGGKLFASLGCQGCHSLQGGQSTGPPLNGLFGTKVQLANGKTVTADVRYLLESIRNPDKEIRKGYRAGIMSGTIKPGSVSQADAQALVDFLKKQK
ncbi:MAG: cytochrome c [Actinomycetota bacterium]|nr:cytochrome c [Actinomycetota bacterium]